MAEPLRDKHEQEAAVAVHSNGGLSLGMTRMCITCQNTFDGELSHCPGDATPLVTLDHDPLIGTMVGKYKILSVIGQGGMGVVYKAEQIVMQRLVALKMIRAGVKDSGVILRFQQEAKAISALNHPNIVTVYECTVSDDGTPYLAMEYVDGKTLADSDIRLNPEQSVDIFIQLCDALGHAHEQGVIHRDLKPGNIVFSSSPGNGAAVSVKILDFGIAKLLPSSGKQYLELTRTGQPIGSPSYMSPEQCRAEELDARSDIYSLGCVMYRVLTGKAMFESESLFKVLGQHLTETPQPFSEACPDIRIPVELEEIVFKALEKNKDRRYQSMGELQDALVTFQLGKESAGQFLSSRIRRVVRYRRKAYIYLAGLLGFTIFVVAGIFSLNLRQVIDEFKEKQSHDVAVKLRQAILYNEQADQHVKLGDYDAAKKSLEKAKSLEAELPIRMDCNLAKAGTLHRLGYVYLKIGQDQESESKLEDSLKLLEANPDANKSSLVSLMQDLAEAKKRLSNFDEASKILERAKIIAKNDPDVLAGCLLREGTIKEKQNDFSSAKNAYLAGLALLQKLHKDNDLVAKPLYERLCTVAQHLGDAKAAALWAQKAAECK